MFENSTSTSSGLFSCVPRMTEPSSSRCARIRHQAKMCTIRPLVEDDLAQVALLYAKVYTGSTHLPLHALQTYFYEVLFKNPWYDTELSSWVYEDNNGRIVGVIGIIPRRMSFDGQPLRMAVGCSLFVDPDHRSTLAGFQLMKKFMAGPQDITLVDGPSRLVQRIWQRLGGEILPFHSLRWLRPLRPARTILHLYSRPHLGLSTLSMPSRLGLQFGGFLSRFLDFATVQLVPRERPADNLQLEPLDVPTLLSCVSEFTAQYRLRPEYDLRELQWLLGEFEKKKKYGPLQKIAIRCARKGLVGWCLYYLNSEELCEVVRFAAREDYTAQALNILFDHVRRQGGAALHGRVEPGLLPALADNYCVYHGRGANILFHARNPEVRAAMLAGDGLATRMEGEWWLRLTEKTLDTI
jgi:GNAT superfamily N-acetyltransferase